MYRESIGNAGKLKGRITGGPIDALPAADEAAGQSSRDDLHYCHGMGVSSQPSGKVLSHA
jgi:hypothetical protein